MVVEPRAIPEASETVGKRRLPTMFSSLEEPNFRMYILGVLLSFIPMAMQQVAQGYLAFTLTGSATALGLVQLVWGVPQLVLTLIAGVVADRYERSRILTVTQGSLAVLAATTGTLVATGLIQYWHLLVVGLFQGAVFAFNVPARQGMMPLALSNRNLANGIAVNNSGLNMTRILGPGIAGALIAFPFVGVAGVYYLMAMAYIAAMVTVWKMRVPHQARQADHEPMIQAIASAWLYIRRSPVLPTLLLLAFVPILLGMPYQTLMPVFALQVMDVGSTGLGALLMMSGVGALAGSLIVAATSHKGKKAVAQLATCVGFGVVLFLFAVSHDFLAALVLMPIIGGLQNVYMALNNTLMMLHTDRAYLGRVMSIYMITWSITPITTLPIAALADAFGAPLIVSIMGLMVSVLSLVIAVTNKRYQAAADIPLFERSTR